MCKSGITTKWTCGIITAKNETVTYTGGKTVYGLTRHTACVEPGDSGGANVSVFYGYHAEGVTSGASMFVDAAGKKRCLRQARRHQPSPGTSRSPTRWPTTARSTASPPGSQTVAPT